MNADTGASAVPYRKRSKRRPHNVPRGLKGMPKFMGMRKKSRYIRRWLLQHPWVRPMLAFNWAAHIIQALVRGVLVRNRAVRRRKRATNVRMKKRGRQLDRYLMYLEYYKTSFTPPPYWINNGFSTWCAVRIQAWWRMIRTKSRMQYLLRGMIYQIATIEIQISWRDYFHRQRERTAIAAAGRISDAAPATKQKDIKRRAAASIQNAWRQFCYKRVYKYFRDLILFKLKGAPSELLRNIIPSEIGLLDKAAGVHVRFRLGGHIFPPTIYFKIYTHRPLCDVNSFAPRNYMKELPFDVSQANQKDDVVIGSKNVKSGTIRVGATYFGAKITTTNTSGEGWYRREENNHWRSISTMIVTDAFNSNDASSVPYGLPKPEDKTLKPFHYSRLVRTIDIVRDRKKRRREWMLKAYLLDAEKHHAKIDDSRGGPESGALLETPVLSRQGSNNIQPDVDYKKNYAVDPLDDELINWRYVFVSYVYRP